VVFTRLDRNPLNLYYYAALIPAYTQTHDRWSELQGNISRAKEEFDMSIVRYDPFRDLRTLQEEVNRLFSNNLSPSFGDEGIGRGAWNPNVDIYENKDQIVLEAELPGMNRDDFELTIENNVITLRGERRFEKTDDSDNYHRVERAYGSFTRSFTLPQTVSGEGANAEYKNGVLRVTLPKREETKARRIEVSGGETKPKTIDMKASETSTPTAKTKEAGA
jgi:HSP20 family protein